MAPRDRSQCFRPLFFCCVNNLESRISCLGAIGEACKSREIALLPLAGHLCGTIIFLTKFRLGKTLLDGQCLIERLDQCIDAIVVEFSIFR